ncbi:argininosuccinate synthase [Candidatus Vidania fulgoroideorum]
MKIIKKLEKNSKVALAYSGGLDTSAAIKWLKRNKINVYAYYADLGNLKKNEIKKIKKKAYLLGAKKFFLINCKKKILKEAMVAIKTRSFNIYCGTGIYFNITPLGRAVTSVAIARNMIANKVKIWSDGSTYKGNDIERFFLYVSQKNPEIKYYKPWLDKNFINELGGRKEMQNFLGIKNNNKTNYSVDSNIIGNTYEGSKLEKLNYNLTNIKFLICNNVLKTKKKTVITIEVRKGNLYKYNNKKIKNLFNLFKKLNKKCGMHNLGISDQIEDRIIGTKSRGVYESPFMYLLYNIYDRLISCLYNKNEINFYRTNGLELGNLLYSGKWYTNESLIRKEVGINFAKKINGRVKILISYNNFYFIETKIFKNNKYISKNSTMEKIKNENFSYRDRIGHLRISKITF